jgi:hypothetical protein
VLIGTVHDRAVQNGNLETWDTATVPDGAYRLRLRVVRKDGNYDERYVRGLSVVNTRPTETPTPATPTGAEPSGPPTITPTPLPATATVIVEKPAAPTAVIKSTPTPGEAPEPTVEPTPVLEVAVEKLGNSFFSGAVVAVAVFAAIGALAAVRALALWLWGLIRR